jgi:membrane protease subunit HflC
MTRATLYALPFIVASLLLIVIANSAFVIDQAQQGIIVQFGEPRGDIITEPGLHWKAPFIQQVRRFDKRLLVWDGDVSQIPTLGREFITIDTTARWRIVDALQFLRSVRDETGARTRLDDIIDSVTRDIISGTDLEEIVRSADWDVDVIELAADEAAMARGDTDLEKPKKGRALMEQEMLTAASRLMPGLGIELVDVRLKRINYLDSVRVQVENRMIAERQSIAERFRSEGQGKSQEILGGMERQLAEISSEAARKAQEIIGKADAEATRIYGRAYGADPEFYAFFQTLESYGAIGGNTTLMIKSNSDFFRYLESTRRR